MSEHASAVGGAERLSSGSTRRAGVASVALLALFSIAAAPAAGRAQSLPLKRTFVAPLPAACGARRAATPVVAAPAKVEESRRLFALGQEASTVGDHRAARDLFQQAAQLNAADERVPYYLGRSLEELRQPRDAAAQYCRYLTLAPTGFDAEDVRARLDRIGTGAGGTVTTAAAATTAAGRRSTAATRFRAAVDLADRGKLTEAERAFDDVIRQLPNAPEAYYDRGVLRGSRRDFGGAAADFDRYLALRPDADDAPAVRERVTLLHRAATSRAVATIPAVGQFYTGRPVLGLAVAGGVAAGVVYALGRSDEERTTTYEGPFGGTYSVTDTVQVRKHLAIGAAVAGASALLGAIEGFAFAERRRSEAARFAAAVDGRGGKSLAVYVAPVLRSDASGGGGGGSAVRPALAVSARLTF